MSGKGIYECSFRVYSEDTDLFDVVYHANYLKYYERARTELFREKGLMLSDSVNQGVLYTIRQTNVRYLLPARLDDLLTLRTVISKTKLCSVWFQQEITNQHGARVSEAEIEVVCINRAFKPQRLPAEIIDHCNR